MTTSPENPLSITRLQRAFACISYFIFAALLAASPASAFMGIGDEPTLEERRDEIREMRDDALQRVTDNYPDANKVITDSVGYAVFSNLGVNLGIVSTQRGGGVLRDNRNDKDTFMRMFSAGGGFGLGIKDYVAIFVFHTEEALDAFMAEGWDFSGQADAKVSDDEERKEGAEMAMTAMPGTSLYQLTKKGLAAQVTLQGTKFWADNDLN